MTDDRDSRRRDVLALDRRRLIGAAAAGSLLGSAWAVAFRDAVIAGDAALITVARTATALGVLYEYRGHRIMLIDAGDEPGASMVTELAAGSLRQRIDLVLTTTAAASALPHDYGRRWNVREVWSLPDASAASSSGFAGKALRIDGLEISADALPFNAWRTGAPSESGWYVAATLGTARFFVASHGDAIGRLPLEASMANALLCNDIELKLATVPAGVGVLAIPREAADTGPSDPRLVALAHGEAVVFRLLEDRIETP